MTAPDLTTELSTLTTFRDRVDSLLTSLTASPASSTSMGRQQFDMNSLGTTVFTGDGKMGFDEVIDLFSTYSTVQEQLQKLSQTLTDQINAMSITVQISQVGYNNVEASQVDTLWTIQQQTAAAVPPPGQTNLTVQQQIDIANQQDDRPPHPHPQTGATTTPSSNTSVPSGTSDTGNAGNTDNRGL
ncbi:MULTISPECIES: hypothetical protein [Streptacidiphilus]|uniref:WXG100 family type VII secretion target n=2 Tax=Streptacidiphilus TaxID=228398 RepID=A0ABV6ULR8_9ACTN|nr:hypothetical protein [Streptacidiphilus jeojiense]